jgi:hypothetical protein
MRRGRCTISRDAEFLGLYLKPKNLNFSMKSLKIFQSNFGGAMIILYSAGLMLGMSLVLGIMIAVFALLFEVKADPRIEQVFALLPSYNCGICGFPGCRHYAEAIVAGHTPLNKCNPGGKEAVIQIRRMMGITD